MAALQILLVALAQSSAPPATQPPDPPIVVVAPTPEGRRICRPIATSTSRIARGRICHTQAEREAEREAEQSAAQQALDPTNQRTGQQLNTSGYGNWARDRWQRPIGSPGR